MVQTVEKPEIRRHQNGSTPSPYFIRLRHRTKYAYDFGNRWVRKVLDSDGDGTADGSTIFVYDGNQIALQFDKTGTGDAAASDLSHRYLWGEAVDQILADETADDGGSEDVLWPLTDHQNTVRDLAEYDSGTDTTTIANHRTYDAFGNITSETAPAVDHLFAYTARPFDEDTNLQNNLNRWYDPTTGRWLSEDPIGFGAEDANLYRYVGNGPMNGSDPLGLFWDEVAAGLGGAWQGAKNIGGAVYGGSKAVVGTVVTGAGEVVGAAPALYQGVNNVFGGDSRAYSIYRAGLNNAWKDVGASAQDIYKPWNPYQASNPVSANDARMAQNAANMRATGAPAWTITTMKCADATGYYASNAAVCCAAAGFNPWLGTAGTHGAHHGLGTHIELILRVGPHKVLKVIIPGKNVWIWLGIK